MGVKDMLLAAAVAGTLLTGLNSTFPQDWTLTSAPSTNWVSVASSADGSRLTAASVGNSGSGGAIWVSTNSGTSWAPTSAPITNWSSIASSSDGTKLITAGSGGVFTSTNFGATWLSNNAPSLDWSAVASSADGDKLFAAVNGGGIYTRQTTPKTVLNLRPSENGFLISWIVPSTPFVLQENADLRTTNWTDVTTTPIFNFTNLHHEVSVPLAGANRFYRLKRL